ncbi:MAG TPA: OmpH family outer membrane protein [Cyclobacteriaceae bacterium]|jgi:outer membrane protein|nr:OmpH family outer membrane protein [Cyclobacteriaceae bacterium]
MRKLFLIILWGSTLLVKAQSVQKIGYAETDYIMSQLPEFKKLDSELKTHYSQLENGLNAKQSEFEVKLKSYKELPASTPQAIKDDRERELATLKRSMEKFKNDAQVSYQKKQNDLLDPLYKRIGNAIEQVAKENDYSFIINHRFENEGQILLVWDEKFNISDLVLKKLGVVPIPRPALKIN